MANIIKTADKYIGYNSHHFVDNLHKVGGRSWSWVGYNTPWCCVFVWDIFYECSASRLFYGGGITASCPAAYEWCKRYTTRVSISDCKAGDIIFFDWNNNASPDHIGFVEKKLNDRTVQTVEGNTNNSVVARRIRDKSTILGIFRPAYTSKTDAGVVKIQRKFKVVNKNGVDMRRGASTRYAKTGHFKYGDIISVEKMFVDKNGYTWYWTVQGKTGWLPLKVGKTIYLHVV